MDELVDVYNELTKEKTKEVISKNIAHEKGIWHSSIHIIIISKDKRKILLQKRCQDKKLYPSMWDISVGGHITSGEEPLTSAKRELKEELGLNPNIYEFKFLEKIKEELINNGINSKEFVYVYLIIADIDINDILLQKEEVSEAKWLDKKEFQELIEKEKIINHFKEFEIIISILK